MLPKAPKPTMVSITPTQYNTSPTTNLPCRICGTKPANKSGDEARGKQFTDAGNLQLVTPDYKEKQAARENYDPVVEQGFISEVAEKNDPNATMINGVDFRETKDGEETIAYFSKFPSPNQLTVDESKDTDDDQVAVAAGESIGAQGGPENKEESLKKGLAAIDEEEKKYLTNEKITEEEAKKVASSIKESHPVLYIH